MGDVLFLAHRVPFPPDRGDKVRSFNILKQLSRHGRVHLGCLAGDKSERDEARSLEDLCASQCIPIQSKPLALAGIEAVLKGRPVSLTAFHELRLHDYVESLISSRQIDTIVVFSGQMGQYVPAQFKGRVLIDLCDVDSAKFENYAQNGQRVWLNRREARLLGAEEARLAARADATFLISKAEADLFRERLGSAAGVDKARIAVAGNGIDTSFFDPASLSAEASPFLQNEQNLVFTGQMDYPPNHEAALWMIGELLPALRRAGSLAHLHIVGRNPLTSLLRKSKVPGCTIWGAVPDMRPFLSSADCVLAPLAIARGVQNKVLEAMAMGRPVLVSPGAATGIDARGGHDWLIAERSIEPMLAQLLPLLDDKAASARIGRNAREFVIQNHAWDAMLAPLVDAACPPLRGERDAA